MVPDLQELLSGMLAKLKTTPDSVAKAATRADADVYLSVAASLLAGELSSSGAGGDAELVGNLFDKAMKAQGAQQVTLFGVQREEGFLPVHAAWSLPRRRGARTLFPGDDLARAYRFQDARNAERRAAGFFAAISSTPRCSFANSSTRRCASVSRGSTTP
ncbi:MAG: hypothetical protein WDO74_25690 [Pseudomonadota bacterium]